MQKFLYAAARMELIVLVSNQLHIRWSEGMCGTFFLHCYDDIAWTFWNKSIDNSTARTLSAFLNKRINIAMEAIVNFGSNHTE